MCVWDRACMSACVDVHICSRYNHTYSCGKGWNTQLHILIKNRMFLIKIDHCFYSSVSDCCVDGFRILTSSCNKMMAARHTMSSSLAVFQCLFQSLWHFHLRSIKEGSHLVLLQDILTFSLTNIRMNLRIYCITHCSFTFFLLPLGQRVVQVSSNHRSEATKQSN